jgi:hypothetical protein
VSLDSQEFCTLVWLQDVHQVQTTWIMHIGGSHILQPHLQQCSFVSCAFLRWVHSSKCDKVICNWRVYVKHKNMDHNYIILNSMGPQYYGWACNCLHGVHIVNLGYYLIFSWLMEDNNWITHWNLDYGGMSLDSSL